MVHGRNSFPACFSDLPYSTYIMDTPVESKHHVIIAHTYIHTGAFEPLYSYLFITKYHWSAAILNTVISTMSVRNS